MWRCVEWRFVPDMQKDHNAAIFMAKYSKNVYLEDGGYKIIENAVTTHPVTWHYIPEDMHFL